jgi:hypothetical protein
VHFCRGGSSLALVFGPGSFSAARHLDGSWHPRAPKLTWQQLQLFYTSPETDVLEFALIAVDPD